MEFSVNSSIEILERTPIVLQQMLAGLSGEWALANEGGDTWSAFDVAGHLIHCEKTNWVPRMHIILSDAADKTFVPFDRLAQFEASKGKTLDELLQEFTRLRNANIQVLKEANLTEQQLDMEGINPLLGKVKLRQLLATWTVHDFTHISQIVRVMAFQYKEAVGPWVAFLSVLKGK